MDAHKVVTIIAKRDETSGGSTGGEYQLFRVGPSMYIADVSWCGGAKTGLNRRKGIAYTDVSDCRGGSSSQEEERCRDEERTRGTHIAHGKLLNRSDTQHIM